MTEDGLLAILGLALLWLLVAGSLILAWMIGIIVAEQACDRLDISTDDERRKRAEKTSSAVAVSLCLVMDFCFWIETPQQQYETAVEINKVLAIMVVCLIMIFLGLIFCGVFAAGVAVVRLWRYVMGREGGYQREAAKDIEVGACEALYPESCRRC